MSLLVEVLEIFAEAQSYGSEQSNRSLSQVLGGGFIVPQAGKTGLSRPPRTEAERKEKRAEIARAKFARDMADPQRVERVRELRRARVRRFRERKVAMGVGK